MERSLILYFKWACFTRSIPQIITPIFLLFIFTHQSAAQTCPPNIDFEQGSFNNWTCYIGTTASMGTTNVISLSPTSGPDGDRHSIFPPNSGERDYFGNFPVNCPNGSGYSVKLGNSVGEGEAEAISYEFTIPASQNSYLLIYNYAVVFEAPNHRESEQPRMEIEILNLTDNKVISCASFAFIASGSSLPGFQFSPNSLSTTSVLYKDWSAVSVDLSGNAGKKIRLIFKTADCTFRKHFGYAYIDVNSECSGTFTGATYCPDDTAVNVVAPFGYQSYTWFDSSLINVLGNQQTLHLTPPPPSGTTIAVKVEPYFGYGCSQVFYARMVDSLRVKANAGNDVLVCNRVGMQIGERPKPGLVYTWSPSAGLNSTLSANPLANPLTPTQYLVQTSSSGGGCRSADTVMVNTSDINNELTVIGKLSFCITDNDSAVLTVNPTDSIRWIRNNVFIAGANKPTFRALSSGNYAAFLKNKDGCSITTKTEKVIIEQPIPAIRYPIQYAVLNYPLPIKARAIGQSFTWYPEVGLNNNSMISPNFIGVKEQLYTIKIKSIGGCVTVDTQLVKVIKEVEVLVPTAFTPNNDGRNDWLRPILIGMKETKYFRIFNRLGQIVFESRTVLPGWNGTHNGLPLGMQTLVWVYEGTGADNKPYLKKGTAVLIR